MVPFWKEAMEMVLDVEPGAFPSMPEMAPVLPGLPNDVPDEDSAKIPDVSIVEASAELLYGLVHQRYVLTRAGLHAMVSEPINSHCSRNYEPKYFQAEKYEAGIFGSCPRVYCMGCNVVPCGRSDLPGLETVKLFCPNCNDIYVPASSRFQGVDGVSPSASAKYSVYLTGVGFLTRRFFWHHIRTSLLPDLSRTYARSVLEAAIFVRFYVTVSVTAQRDGQQLFSTGAVRQSQPPWWPKTCRGESICPPNLRV